MDELDADLVARAREGDAAAFDELVRRHLRPAYAVALARAGNPQEAEDAVQDAFLTALQRLDDCQEPARFGAWLTAIVRHRALDLGRRQRVRAAAPLEVAEQQPAPGSGSPTLRLELLAALGELTTLQREVALLFDLEGWTHQEIAAHLGISPGAARVHLHDAREKLRKRLGGH